MPTLQEIRDGRSGEKKRPTRSILESIRDSLDGYWNRQGQMAQGGLQMAEQGAQSVRGGDMGGLAGMLLGPAGYLASPISALLPTSDETYAAGDLPEWAKPGIAGGMAGMMAVMPGPKFKGLGNVRAPARSALNSAAESTFTGRALESEATMPISSLSGGVRLSDPTEVSRVKNLAQQISGPGGYFERIIVDSQGNVIEGQHRLEALRSLGVSDVPVVVLKGASEGLGDAAPMLAAAKSAGLHREQAQQLVDNIGEIIAKGDNPSDYAPPRGFEAAWNAALKARGTGKPKGLGRGIGQLADDATDAERAALASRLETEAGQVGGAPSAVSRDEALANLTEAEVAQLRARMRAAEDTVSVPVRQYTPEELAKLRERLGPKPPAKKYEIPPIEDFLPKKPRK